MSWNIRCSLEVYSKPHACCISKAQTHQQDTFLTLDNGKIKVLELISLKEGVQSSIFPSLKVLISLEYEL